MGRSPRLRLPGADEQRHRRAGAWPGRRRDKPTPLPVQALDHATGYLLAAAVIRGVTRQVSTGRGTLARTSLARMAAELVAAGEQSDTGALPESLPERDEQTFWGAGKRLAPPLRSAMPRCAGTARPPRSAPTSPAWSSAERYLSGRVSAPRRYRMPGNVSLARCDGRARLAPARG